MSTTSHSESQARVLEFIWRDRRSTKPVAERLQRPEWSIVKDAIGSVFEFGGFARMNAHPSESGWLVALSMEAVPGRVRLTLLYNGDDDSHKFLQWSTGEVGGAPTVIADHPWDSRTICCDVGVAIEIFGRVFDNPELLGNDLSEFKSPWFLDL
jgi:hypothetical protein